VFQALHLLLLKVYRRLPRRLRLALVHLVSPSFTVGAICVIERADGQLLLVRHSYRNHWGFAGGLVQRGEAIDEGARREVREEVGLDVELVGEPAVVVAPSARRVDVVYRCRVATGSDPDTARPRSPEITDARWFPRDALPELQHEASGGLVALARTIEQPWGNLGEHR
jgi:8-oxo-dGTP diphosphatase